MLIWRVQMAYPCGLRGTMCPALPFLLDVHGFKGVLASGTQKLVFGARIPLR
jgi:hypothetical protein